MSRLQERNNQVYDDKIRLISEDLMITKRGLEGFETSASETITVLRQSADDHRD